ncbi:MAG: STAS/SEC14 domain-containing protein [Gemmatimonadetes bacterium]|nr:STAS/SEC14 domain-containing protein [Gemmatimonadota bacterium]
MIATMSRSSGNVLGFSVSGYVTRADYETLTPAVAEAVKEFGSICLLLDLTGFHWEKMNAWGADLHFGKEFHDKIDKMAIVGDRKWEKHLATLCTPFYAREAKFFETDDDAWTWLD